MSFFRRFAKPAQSSRAPEFLIAGLGNPGKKYAATRHNAGFLCTLLLAQQHNFEINRLRFQSLTGEVTLAGHRCLVLQPQTFMNNSGVAIKAAADFYKIPPENIIVVFDDVSLPPGRLRIRRKGSDGGHNGIKSILYHLQSDAFPRIKLGVGAKPNPEWDMADWVLSKMSDADMKALRTASEQACDALELLVAGDIEKAMGLYNS